MLELLAEPLRLPYMQRAFLEVLIVGALCGLVGTFVVLRGLAFIGDALIHSVFPGVVLSVIAGYNIMIGAFVFGALTTLGIGIVSRNHRVGHEAAIGVVFAAFFALGIVLASLRTDFQGDLDALLFGDILDISWQDVVIALVVATTVAGILLALLKEFALVAFDNVLAHSDGYPVFTLDIILYLLITATVVVSLQVVGNLLVLALLVTPAATARLLTDGLNRMLSLSVLTAVLSGTVGLYIAYYAGLSASGSIALSATALFLLALVLAPRHGLISQRLLARRGGHHEHHFHPEEEEAEIR